MSIDVNLHWQGKMAFQAGFKSGHEIVMDASPEVGGENRGPKPMELVLAALGGCTAMDVVSILNKMRQPLEALDVSLTGERAADHPHVYTSITVLFTVKGEGIEREKVEKAMRLSAEKYCSVGNMINRTAAISYELDINGSRFNLGVIGGSHGEMRD